MAGDKDTFIGTNRGLTVCIVMLPIGLGVQFLDDFLKKLI